MNQSIKAILTSLITAAIIGNATLLYQFSQRLTSIETQLKFLVAEKTTTNLTQK